jgi:hypothetical protein
MTDAARHPSAHILGTHTGPSQLSTRATRLAARAPAQATSGCHDIPTSRHPYRWPAVVAAAGRHQPVWITDTVDDVDALVDAGVEACCAPDGLGRWRDEDSGTLTGARAVFVVSGQDALDHAWSVAGSMYRGGVTASAVEVLIAPTATVAEFVRGGALHLARRLLEAADIGRLVVTRGRSTAS